MVKVVQSSVMKIRKATRRDYSNEKNARKPEKDKKQTLYADRITTVPAVCAEKSD